MNLKLTPAHIERARAFVKLTGHMRILSGTGKPDLIVEVYREADAGRNRFDLHLAIGGRSFVAATARLGKNLFTWPLRRLPIEPDPTGQYINVVDESVSIE